ncbi:unnamed protein product, partial [Mesorhabditis spiculigera]
MDTEWGAVDVPYDEYYEADNLTSDDIAAWLNGLDSGDSQPDVAGWSALVNTAFGFGVSYVSLGLVAIVLNGTFLYALISRRRHVFSHVFYVMIFNFVLIDCLKGICSILFALKLLKSDMDAMGTLWIVKIDQMSAFLLRFSNLATILNLTMITINEYLFICYPLQYPNYVTRARVFACLIAAWIISFALTISNAVVTVAHQSIFIDLDCQAGLADDLHQSTNETDVFPCLMKVEPSRSAQYVYHFGVILFCGLCLAITATSYIVLLKVIAKLVKTDLRSSAEIAHLKDAMANGEERAPVEEKNVVRRHKYVAVIGTVIVVYAVYLTAYATIQILQLLNMSSGASHASRYIFVYIKYVCYTFISLHSILQPVCYLRMREFRALIVRAVCGSRRRPSDLLGNEPVFSGENRRTVVRENKPENGARRSTAREYV